jgi:hypothetical protein
MRTNEGFVDRAVRAAAGTALLIVGFGVVQGIGGAVIGIVGIVPLVTGMTGYCPLYAVLGIDTLGKHAPRGGSGMQPR